MKVIVFGKSNRHRGPRPVDMINCNKKYASKESEGVSLVFKEYFKVVAKVLQGCFRGFSRLL